MGHNCFADVETKVWIWDDALWNEFHSRDEVAHDRQLMATAMQDMLAEEDMRLFVGKDTAKGKGRGAGGGRGGGQSRGRGDGYVRGAGRGAGGKR